MSYYPGGHYSQKMLAIAVDSDRNSKLTARSDSKLLSDVNGKIFKGNCYRLYHEEEELLLDCRNVWRVERSDVVNYGGYEEGKVELNISR